MDEKRPLLEQGASDADLTNIRKEVSKPIRKDKRQYILNNVSKGVDIRDQFLGLGQLRNAFTPIPLGMKDKTGKHVPFARRAEAAAEFLGTVFWGGITPS